MTLHLAKCSDKIKWILLKDDFDQDMLDRTTHILDAHLHIWLYHALYHTQAQYADTIWSIHRAAAPKHRKDATIAKAEIAKHKCADAAQLLMETKLDSSLMMDALEGLLPLKLQDEPQIILLDQQAEKTVIAGIRNLPPTVEIQDGTCFSFVPIEEDNIIVGPTPWRLIRKRPDGILILVHDNNFPITYDHTTINHKLLTAIPTISSLALETICLHTEDAITHYLNVKHTLIIPKHGTSRESIYYDEPYNFITDIPVSTQDYWDTTSTLHTLEQVFSMTLNILINGFVNFNWEERTFVPLDIPEQIMTMQQVARDLVFPQPGSLLAAVKTKDIYIICTTTNEQVILETTSHKFLQLMHTLYTTLNTQRLDTLHTLITKEPKDTLFLASILPIVANLTFLQTIDKGSTITYT